jgi:hypothetical protein
VVTEASVHIALIGDSIFDNAAYTNGGPDTVTHLRRRMGDTGQATLLAMDGATTHMVPTQVDRLPKHVTHIAVSVGGNDLLPVMSVLDESFDSPVEILVELDRFAQTFEQDYRNALAAVASHGLPSVVCLPYNGWFPEEPTKTALRAALRMFADVMQGVATDHGLPVIDLRGVCTEAEDYWNPIEPNAQGGEKVAEVVWGWVRGQ